jgi:hypothetical protein
MGEILKFPKRPSKPRVSVLRGGGLKLVYEFENDLAAKTAIMAFQLHNNIMLFFSHIDQLKDSGSISTDDAAYIESVAYLGLEPEEIEPDA